MIPAYSFPLRSSATHFFQRENFFLFFCWSCSRRLRGIKGRAEDPFGGKKSAEAGPPGKRFIEVEAKTVYL
jgi:hypothetical protein